MCDKCGCDPTAPASLVEVVRQIYDKALDGSAGYSLWQVEAVKWACGEILSRYTPHEPEGEGLREILLSSKKSGKTTASVSAFMDECRKGIMAMYCHKDFVAMSWEYYKDLYRHSKPNDSKESKESK